MEMAQTNLRGGTDVHCLFSYIYPKVMTGAVYEQGEGF